MKKIMLLCIAVVLLSSCAIREVRQSDLETWKGVPVEALDTHSLFLTVPMVKTITESGVEIRNYVNKVGISSCSQNAFGAKNSNVYGAGNTAQVMSYANFNSFQNCSSRMVGCDNIFYIRDGKVLEYKPVGRCYTDDTVRPEQGWERFTKK
jgi:hypothetical protein